MQGKNSITPTLTTRIDNSSSIYYSPDFDVAQNVKKYYIDLNNIKSNKLNCRIRVYTPREAWRLMGFFDADIDKVEGKVSAPQMYKQAGNSIVVHVLEAILKQLFLEEI